MICLTEHATVEDTLWGPREKLKNASEYFAFSVILFGADIATDLLTTADFFIRGNFYWGNLTLIPMFAPLLGQGIIITWNRQSPERSLADEWSWKNELLKLLWSFPLMQPIRQDTKDRYLKH